MKKPFYLIALSITLIFSFCPLSHTNVIPLQNLDISFNKVLQNNQFVFIDFWMPGCPPCKKIAPRINQLSNEFANVLFISINIREFPAIAAQYNIRSVPNLKYIKNGVEVGGQIGGNTALQTMRNTIHNLFGI